MPPPAVAVGGPIPPETQVEQAAPQDQLPGVETDLVVVDGVINEDGVEPRWILSEPIIGDKYEVRVKWAARIEPPIGTRFRILSSAHNSDYGITFWLLMQHETRFCVTVVPQAAILFRPVYQTWIPMVYQ